MGFIGYQYKKLTGNLIKIDSEKLIQEDKNNYKLLGIDFDEGINLIKNIFGDKFLDETLSFKKNKLSTSSYQFILFAALSQKFKINKILEIGTYDGKNAFVLSKIFNKAEIVTIDLPTKDITEGSFGEAINSIGLKKHFEIRNKNLLPKNITFVESNSFFLPSLDNYKFNNDYDLIFVDGNHIFPEVSWDTFFAYNHLKKNGKSFLIMDDYLNLNKSNIYNKGRKENNVKVSIVDVFKMCEKLKSITKSNYITLLKTHPDIRTRYVYPKKLKSLAIFKF
tara:strand:+ start:288 stop:1124 length:837 start_codon:yes stop_codon:yes gene_type:complete